MNSASSGVWPSGEPFLPKKELEGRQKSKSSCLVVPYLEEVEPYQEGAATHFLAPEEAPFLVVASCPEAEGAPSPGEVPYLEAPSLEEVPCPVVVVVVVEHSRTYEDGLR